MAAGETGEGEVRPAIPTGELYREALTAYRSGDLDGARRLLDRALEAAPRDAGLHTLRGWVRLRSGDVEGADRAFEAAIGLAPDASEPRAGRGFASLRGGDAEAALAFFDAALERDPDHAEARAGKARALLWLDRPAEAQAVLESIQGGADPGLEDLVSRVEAGAPPLVEARPRPAAPPPGPVQRVARAGEIYLEVPVGDGWRPLFVKGVNLGVALPGKFPSEFPLDVETYRGWLDLIAAMNANVVRAYTLLPPPFYRALADYNDANPRQPLWLIQGVWASLPPGYDFDDAAYKEELQREVERVVDAAHGNLDLPPRPGRASGRYRADVSGRVLALILGREWEPFAVEAFDAKYPGEHSFEGRYVRLEAGSAMEAWLAWLQEVAVAYETGRYNVQRPVAFSNWPTLDPLTHPTEARRSEEIAMRRERGEVVDEAPAEVYDDDAVQVDAERIRPTRENRAGLFASYHVYPYYPDFMNLDPGYRAARDSRGPSPYIGYLRDLRSHHAGQPLLVAELGVPTSRGVAHRHPEGWNHGGHTEAEQGHLVARLMTDVLEAGAAGGIVFAWLDEWFKRTWMYASLEVPAERNRLWRNTLDPEQHFGILAAEAGLAVGAPRMDGDPSEWAESDRQVFRGESYPGQGCLPARRGKLKEAAHAVDAAYVHIMMILEGADCDRDGAWDADAPQVILGVDTYSDDAGERHLFPDDVRLLPTGVEFRVLLAGEEGSEIGVVPSYDIESHMPLGPFASVASEDGTFVRMTRESNRRRFGRDGIEYPGQRVDQSPLRTATDGDPGPVADVATGVRGTEGVIELRLPWGLLQFTDPSGHQVLDQPERGAPPYETSTTDRIRFYVSVRDGEELDFQSLDPVRWEGWEEPVYHLRLKDSYDILRHAFAAIPDRPREK